MTTLRQAGGADRPKIFGWLSMELAITISSLLVAVVMAFGNVKSDARDLSTRVDQQEREIDQLRLSAADSHRLLMDLNARIEVLLERTKPHAL